MQKSNNDVCESSLRSRKNEARRLLKRCFKNPVFSLVPFEIWRDFIVSSADIRSVALISQTCYAFKEIVDEIGEKNFNLALMFRKEDQICLAKKYLLKCAENNNTNAMFHIGYSYFFNGWGLEHDVKKAANWFEKAAKGGHAAGMAFYSYSCQTFFGQFEEMQTGEKSYEWGSKALVSKNASAIGFCYYWGLGTPYDTRKAVSSFEESAKEGDEFAQFFYAFRSRMGGGVNVSDAFYWFLKSSERGLADSQYELGCMYRDGVGCEIDVKKAIFWLKRAENQGLSNATAKLSELEKTIQKK